MKSTVSTQRKRARDAILIYPNPLLNKASDKICNISDEIISLISTMINAMVDAPGIGLAAPQVGVLKRLIVVDPSYDDDSPLDKPFAMINPEIVASKGEVTGEEGCLSMPGLYTDISRPEYIKARYLNTNGKELDIEATGLTARCIAHETDHLDGILFWDHLYRVKREWLKLKLRRLLARAR